MARKSYAPEPSSRQVLRHLRPLLRAMGVETALELGPGWGSYTLDLAALCRRVPQPCGQSYTQKPALP